MTTSSDRRQFWRASFHSPATLRGEAGDSAVEVLDLSLKGALVEVPAGWSGAAGNACELHLPLSEDIAIVMEARVAYRDGTRAGLRCEHIDLDSITHLRRLVTLNSGDPEQLERELAHLLS